jgi:hypothetical protein
MILLIFVNNLLDRYLSMIDNKHYTNHIQCIFFCGIFLHEKLESLEEN